MKRVVIVLFFLAGVFLSESSFAQCGNAIKIIKASIDKQRPNAGSIAVTISSTSEFVCRLNIEKGSGPEKVKEVKRSGNQEIEFNGLDKDQIYQVVVEFINEEKQACRKLQQSQIILE